jgi:hypothetical protein
MYITTTKLNITIFQHNLSKSSEEKLVEHLGDEWERIQSNYDVLELWKVLQLDRYSEPNERLR